MLLNQKLLFRFLLTFHLLLLTVFLLLVSPPAVHGGWVRQPSNTTLKLWDVCFVDSLYGWAVGGFDDPTPTPSRGICLKTTDGGGSWTVVYDTTNRSVMVSVSFVNRSRGWMMGDSSFSLATSDGGISWTVLPQIGTYFSAFALRFVNDSLGYLVGGAYFGGIMEGSTLSRSTDGGLSWTMAVPYRYGKYLFALDTYGSGYAWTAGRVDTVYRSTNAGSSWLSFYFPSQFRSYVGVAFGDTSKGVAVGSNGYLLGTSDGGRSWAQRPSPTTQGLYSAEMPDPQNAWACGAGGTIIASTDAGMTWATQVSGTPVTLRKIWFVDDRQGWAVGDSGVILHTEDGGRSGVEVFPSHESRVTSYRVFPNPFTSFASVPGHEAERFSLYDVSGRRVGVYMGDRVGADIPPGVYFLRPVGQNSRPLRVVKVR